MIFKLSREKGFIFYTIFWQKERLEYYIIRIVIIINHMERNIYWFWIELEKEKVSIINHELAFFEERVFKILMIKDRIDPQDYESQYKVFIIEQNETEDHGKSYEIKKILKE